MRGILKSTIAIMLVTLIAACGAKKNDKQQDVNEKDSLTAADYVEQARFTSLQGDSVDIAEFKGKVVLIDFWETWCKPCLASFPGIDSLKTAYPDKFEVLAVTPGFTDTEKEAQNFADNHNYDFTYLMDAQGLHKKLGVRGIPFKVYVDANGKFIDASMGSSGPTGDYNKIKEIIEKQSAESKGTK
jgi:thiol-disulfide isomerase/thioredoxin